MYVTASKDTRSVLSSNWGGVERLYDRYNSLMSRPFRDLRPQEKHELESVRQNICAAEFDRVESPPLRSEKFLHIGDNSKRCECDAIAAVSKKSKAELGMLTTLFRNPKKVPGELRFMLKLAGRLIINHTGGVLENAGLCLHPHAGIPYIPGSAVKGVARRSAWCEWANALDAGDEQSGKMMALKIALVFGFPSNDDAFDGYCRKEWPELFDDDRGRHSASQGTIAFMPAMPVEYVEIVTDIVNCHHSKYYNGKQSDPFDNEKPNPQFFPAVEKGAVFEFSVRPLNRAAALAEQVGEYCDVSASNLTCFARESLRRAAEDYGFGSKTSNGYGWFYDDQTAVETITQKVESERQLAEENLAFESLSDEEKRYVEWRKMDNSQFADLLNHIADQNRDDKLEIIKILLEEKQQEWKRLKKAKKGKAFERCKKIKAAMSELGVQES